MCASFDCHRFPCTVQVRPAQVEVHDGLSVNSVPRAFSLRSSIRDLHLVRPTTRPLLVARPEPLALRHSSRLYPLPSPVDLIVAVTVSDAHTQHPYAPWAWNAAHIV